tara:strand:- start:36 stop:398 length:363 start_codon:yes stop_codon:yes gene_type:complete
MKLEKLAIRIGQISDKIKELKSQREINLDKCAGSEDEDFESGRKLIDHSNGQKESCLYAAYEMVKEDRDHGDYNASFDEAIMNYGCLNCVGAYKAKGKIGLLKKERGRIVGNISKIGKSL